MSRAALSLSPCKKRANSACVILIGSPPCFVIQSRRSGPPSTRPISFRSPDAYLWGYHAPRKNAIVLEFSPSRSGAILHEFFPRNWSGEVQTDGASMYPWAFKHRPNILHIECIGHLRRYVLEAIKAD